MKAESAAARCGALSAPVRSLIDSADENSVTVSVADRERGRVLFSKPGLAKGGVRFVRQSADKHRGVDIQHQYR